MYSAGSVPVIGVVYHPVSGDLYTACRGEGAFLNGVKVEVRPAQGLGDALVVNNIGPARDEAFIAATLGRLGELLRRNVQAIRMSGEFVGWGVVMMMLEGVAMLNISHYYNCTGRFGSSSIRWVCDTEMMLRTRRASYIYRQLQHTSNKQHSGRRYTLDRLGVSVTEAISVARRLHLSPRRNHGSAAPMKVMWVAVAGTLCVQEGKMLENECLKTLSGKQVGPLDKTGCNCDHPRISAVHQRANNHECAQLRFKCHRLRNGQCVIADTSFCTPRQLLIPSPPKHDARRVGGPEHVPRRLREARLLLRRRVWWTVGRRRGSGHRQRGEAHSAVVGATLQVLLAPLNTTTRFVAGSGRGPVQSAGPLRLFCPTSFLLFSAAKGRRGRCRCSGHSRLFVTERCYQ